jgi:hypothetical protein
LIDPFVIRKIRHKYSIIVPTAVTRVGQALAPRAVPVGAQNEYKNLIILSFFLAGRSSVGCPRLRKP